MYKLKCALQNYDWGQKGSDSLVARIFSANGGNVDENKRYAEYWMGTHINGPSIVEFSSDEKVKLSDFMKEKYGSYDGLPFLFKVLSIKEPLSIQLHPDKQMAEILHKEEPSHYKDPNHKPEMAIILSEMFEMFYGLLKMNDASELVKILLPYFNASQSEEFSKSCEVFLIDRTEESYKLFLKQLILLQENEYKAVIKAINDSFKELAKSLGNEFFALKIKLFKEFLVIFKEDRGLLFSMFMNYLLLKQGDFIFINANVPHAYIRGDCAECMANSDNVIRLGLTSKFVDATNFLKILDKEFNNMSNKINDNITPLISENSVTYFNPKYDDFKIIKICLKNKQFTTANIENHSILFASIGNFLIQDPFKKEIQVNSYETYFIEKNTDLFILNLSEEESFLFIASF